MARDFESIQHWEGRVVQVDGPEVFVNLTDLTDPAQPDLVATIDMSRVPDTDHHLVEPGAIFDFRIGYFSDDKKSMTYQIKFRTPHVWTKEDIERAREYENRFDKLFKDTEDSECDE